jgi:glycosyltransferase involved in cell wall biosynthesis
MRVAIVVKEFPPDVIGGTETQTRRMAAALAARGHAVTVYTKSYPDGGADADDADTPYDLVRVPTWHASPLLSTLTFCLFALLALLRDRRKHDVVQCMMIYPVGFVGYLAARLAGLPYFAWIRGGDYYFMKDHPAKRWTIRRVFADTLVLVQTDRIRADVHREFPDATLRVLGNGVDEAEETADGDAVVFVGRLTEQKGVHVLIEALADLDERLLVVGDGAERGNLVRRARTRGVDAEFVGEVDPDAVSEYLRRGKVFVLPAVRGEGLPNAMLEAMAVGLPVVVTDTGGVADAVEEGETGFVVDPGDAGALSDRIERLSADGERRREMGVAAREYVRETHGWDRIVGELEEVYDDVAGGRR